MMSPLARARACRDAARRDASIGAEPPTPDDGPPDGLVWLDTLSIDVPDDADFLTMLQAVLPALELAECTDQ